MRYAKPSRLQHVGLNVLGIAIIAARTEARWRQRSKGPGHLNQSDLFSDLYFPLWINTFLSIYLSVYKI